MTAPSRFATHLAERRRLQRATGPAPGRRILLHVGPHKSGSSSIQQLLETNHLRLPLTHDLIRRTETELVNLTRPIHALRSEADVGSALPGLLDNVRHLASATSHVPVTIVSHEDLLGILPTRDGVRGLYRLAPLVLPPLMAALSETGAQVELLFYLREWEEWKRSLFTYRSRATVRPYDAERFVQTHDLPDGWTGLLNRLRAAVTPHPLHLLSFDKDRQAGFMGQGLLLHAGLSPDQMARLRRTPPKKVSQPATLLPPPAPDSPAG